jgi:hypothetical protein
LTPAEKRNADAKTTAGISRTIRAWLPNRTLSIASSRVGPLLVQREGNIFRVRFLLETASCGVPTSVY